MQLSFVLYLIGVIVVIALLFRAALTRRYVHRINKQIDAIEAKTAELTKKRRQQAVDDYNLSLHEPYKGKKNNGT